MASTYLVTGGAGFIGSHLVDALLARGNDVRVIDDFSAGRKEYLQDALATGRCTVVEGTVTDAGLMKEMCTGVDVVFHLATHCVRASLNDPWTNHQTNTTGTLRVLEAALQAKVQRFIYVSSSEIYGSAQFPPMDESHPTEPMTIYGASKLAGELYTKAYYRTYGLPVTIVRPFNTYGPREHYLGKSAEVIPRFFIKILNDQPITVFGDGTQSRDFMYVADTARGLCMVAEASNLIGETINLAYGQEVGILDIGQKLATILKKPLITRQLAGRPGDVHRLWASNRKAAETIGFQAQIGIDEGLGRYVQWCLQSGIDWSAVARDFQDSNW